MTVKSTKRTCIGGHPSDIRKTSCSGTYYWDIIRRHRISVTDWAVSRKGPNATRLRHTFLKTGDVSPTTRSTHLCKFDFVARNGQSEFSHGLRAVYSREQVSRQGMYTTIIYTAFTGSLQDDKYRCKRTQHGLCPLKRCIPLDILTCAIACSVEKKKLSVYASSKSQSGSVARVGPHWDYVPTNSYEMRFQEPLSAAFASQFRLLACHPIRRYNARTR